MSTPTNLSMMWCCFCLRVSLVSASSLLCFLLCCWVMTWWRRVRKKLQRVFGINWGFRGVEVALFSCTLLYPKNTNVSFVPLPSSPSKVTLCYDLWCASSSVCVLVLCPSYFIWICKRRCIGLSAAKFLEGRGFLLIVTRRFDPARWAIIVFRSDLEKVPIVSIPEEEVLAWLYRAQNFFCGIPVTVFCIIYTMYSINFRCWFKSKNKNKNYLRPRGVYGHTYVMYCVGLSGLESVVRTVECNILQIHRNQAVA